ncbi:TPA: Lar family restriction alleviation protein [Burkholderia cenocepacia]
MTTTENRRADALTDLLPCPFCNGTSEFDSDDSGYHWVACRSCGVSSDTARHCDDDCRERLTAAWNTRATPPVSQPAAAPIDEPSVNDTITFSGDSLTLSGAQLLEALDFIAPDRDADQLESEVTIQYGEGHTGKGMYCWCTEYPEEGAIFIDGSTAVPAAPAPAPSPADERAAFEWPLLPLLPEAVITTADGEAVFTAHQMQGYANAYGEMVRARAASANETGAEGAKSVATVRVTNGGYGMELSTHVAYALPEGHHELYARAPAQAPEPVAWVRKHPDTGELSGDWLWNDVIEQCRKDSGVWFPLGFVAATQPTAQPAAREVLTDEQREALQHAINAAEEDCAYTTATTLRTIIATHPRQPEPRAEVTDDARERHHWNPVYNTDPVQRACAELPEGWGINACMERDAGWVEVYGPDGEEPNFESDADHFDWRIHEAIDFAIDAARTGASS